MSQASHAEVQSTKTQPQNENRELSASASRKDAQKEGKAEKSANKAGGSSQDGKPERAVAEKNPSSGADEDSKTGKVKGGHDESGQPKDDKLKGKGGKIEKDEKKKEEHSTKDEEKQADSQDEEDEEEQQGQQAFSIASRFLTVLTLDPETGEINWDCPCLGDMPHGPCGQQFRKAFSCFVHSEAEPKGQDCIDAFGEMQDCFRYQSLCDDAILHLSRPESILIITEHTPMCINRWMH
jgi:mitochondrial intermembrane space import and assembly protein 40